MIIIMLGSSISLCAKTHSIDMYIYTVGYYTSTGGLFTLESLEFRPTDQFWLCFIRVPHENNCLSKLKEGGQMLPTLLFNVVTKSGYTLMIILLSSCTRKPSWNSQQV